MSTQPPSLGPKKISFADRLLKEYILLDLKSETKEDAIRELAECLRGDANLLDFDRFVKDVFKREQSSSTGIGKGVAIPHARTDTVQDFIVAIGRKSPGIEFGAVDDKPVEILILMGTPLAKVNMYLKLLAHLTNLLKRPGFVEGLKTAADPDAVIALFRGLER